MPERADAPRPDLVVGPRPGRMRDRRGRGARGPFALPGPLSPHSVPVHRGPRARFDALVADVLAALDKHFAAEPDEVEVVVEDVPLLPPEWVDEVPLSSVTRTGDLSRIVLYRWTLTDRAADATDLSDLVWQVLLDRLAEVWQVSPDDIDPRRD